MPKNAKPEGRFIGRFAAEFLSGAESRGGRLVRLLEPFSYVDPFDLQWDAPSGWTVDGASIPQPLWSLVGSPFTGEYRQASVIHDCYCDTKQRPWGAVHRVFYDAMLTSGVNGARAKLMYAAVCWGGPRWSVETVNTYQEVLRDYLDDSRHPTGRFGHASSRVHKPMPHDPDMETVNAHNQTVTRTFSYPFDDDDLRSLEQQLAASDVPAEGIEAFVGGQIQARGLTRLSSS